MNLFSRSLCLCQSLQKQYLKQTMGFYSATTAVRHVSGVPGCSTGFTI